MDRITIRESRPGDVPDIRLLYPAAFPDEDLMPVVTALLSAPHGVRSLVADVGGSLAGHIIFTTCSIAEEPEDRHGTLALLGPLAVTPSRQRQGIGSALIRHGLQLFEPSAVTHVLVLGDPAYYGRSGFTTETAIAAPYPLPDEWRAAWQSIRLPGAPDRQGTLSAPPPWQQPALWSP